MCLCTGKQFEIFSLLHDSASNLDIWEVRKECDEHWEKVGQYCFYFGIKELNYNSAQDFCHDANAQLVDDLSESKHNLLKENSEDFWLGLKNSGHGYVWDRPLPQEPVALSQSEQYWAGNGSIPVYDTNKQCVFWDSKAGVYPNTWTPDNCYNLRPFICQKHRYDSNNTNPNDIDTGDIPAGKWYAKITTNSSLSSNLGCYIDIRVQSSLQIATAFTTEVSQDAPNYDPVAGSKLFAYILFIIATNRVTTFVRSQDMGHRSPRLTHAMLWDATNGTLYDAMTYSPRFGCTFPWITQTFKCPRSQQANIEFGISHIGEDEFGNSFQRVTFGHCTKPQISCGNGGIRSNGKCVCTEYWTAECEPEIRTTFSPNWKTLVLVVETTIHNKPAVDTLVKNINTVIADALQNNPDWFQNYALVTFDTNGVSFSNFQYRNAADLTEALKQAYANITTLGSCDMPIYNAIGFASKSQEIASSNSEILLVTSASNSSTANNERQIAKERLINSQAHLNYFYISNDKCSEEFTDTEVAQLAYVSGGNVLTSNSENLSTLLDAYLPTLYSSSVLRNPTIGTNFKCEDGEIQYVQVDQNTTSIYVTAIAEFGTLGVLNPLRRIIEAATLYRNGKTTIYKIDTDDIAGIYSLSLNSPGPCYIHVYSVGGTKVYTEFALTSKTDPKGSHADGNYTNPFTGTGNIATFHLYGAPGHKGMLQYAEIFDPFTSQLLLRSDLYRRDHCSFEYYSDPFDCKSEFLIIFVYGVDENMQQFRREEATYCRGTYKTSVIPPSTLPTTMVPTTNPMDVKFDVAVLIDVTKEANTTYDNMTNFISELLSIYSVSQSGVRVALIPVTNDGVISVATFDTISSNKNLVGYFKQIKTDYNDFDKMGQALEQALNITIDINFMNAGYRKNINNHVIIYVTSSTTFTDKPQNAVNKILTDGTYGIITVGFVSGISNTSILEHIAGGRNCSFPAETYDLMKSHIQDIRNLISKAEYSLSRAVALPHGSFPTSPLGVSSGFKSPSNATHYEWLDTTRTTFRIGKTNSYFGGQLLYSYPMDELGKKYAGFEDFF
uniref:C-type lectin domain-containing protein n=1 Tax=Heterorhabditis bacteriophora TaxID=37862 RepID=A0A1I7XUF1_HETBA